MAVTRLGWDVITSSASNNLKSFPWVTGMVRAGDAYTVLDYYCKRYNAEVEAIRKDWSWGYNYRAVRGANVFSEHSAGTALDLNAPKHPLGTTLAHSFSARQIVALKALVNDPIFEGCLRHGGWYLGRKDPMHVELQGGAAKLSGVAKSIKALESGTASKPSTVKPKPKAWPYIPTTVGNRTKAWDELLKRVGYTGKTVERRQKWLKKLGYYTGLIDNKWGPMTSKAQQEFLKAKGLYKGKITGKVDTATKNAEVAYLEAQRKIILKKEGVK